MVAAVGQAAVAGGPYPLTGHTGKKKYMVSGLSLVVEYREGGRRARRDGVGVVGQAPGTTQGGCAGSHTRQPGWPE